MANWYKELKEIDEMDKILAIAVAKRKKGEFDFYESKLYSSVEEAKKVLDYEFDSGYGGSEGPAFTAWTKNCVIFPVTYDGKEWIEVVPRNPVNRATEHIGSE